MKRFRVEFSLEAQEDIESSFDWGVRHWGLESAIRWYKQITTHTRKVLAITPLACPIAPEGKELDREVRHLIFGRHRILFEVEGRLVKVLNVRGSYVDKDHKDLGVNE